MRRPQLWAGMLSGCFALLAGCTQPFHPHQVHQNLPVSQWERMFEDQLHVRFGASSDFELVSAYQRRSTDEQVFEDLILANDTALAGENRLMVALRFVRNRRDTPLLLESGGNYKFRPDDVDRALRDWLPGVAIDRSPRIRSNRYGRYSYVDGESRDGTRCVYAWQVVRYNQTALPGGLKDVALQMRYCDSSKTAEEIIRNFDDLSLVI